MITLLKNGLVYAPAYQGKCDLLIAGERIEALEPSIDAPCDNVRVIECSDKLLVPGFIDGHVHLIGGGECPSCHRIPESKASEFIACGVTTVLGLLGTDGISKSLESLYTKCISLENEGISTYMLTGAYQVPPPTLCGSVMRDLVLINKVIGVKTAISDHRSSATTNAELSRLCAEARVGGLLANKAGLCVIHIGSGKSQLDPIITMLENSDIPRNKILPTHVGRTPDLFAQAIKYAKEGGHIDLTASHGSEYASAAQQIRIAMEAGVPVDSLTMSSDAYGSIPIFDDEGNFLDMSYFSSRVLTENIKAMVLEEKIPLEDALKIVSSNVAARMGLASSKGHLQVGWDADIVIMNRDYSIRGVFCKGKEMIAMTE